MGAVRLGVLARATANVLAVGGLLLLALNLVGLVVPLRSPHVAEGRTYFGAADVTLSEADVLRLVERRSDEPNLPLIERATWAVNQGLAHDLPAQLPITENWLLWLYDLRDSAYEWELIDHRKALEQGFGLCSQHAIVLEGLLEEQGVRSQILALGSLHVVNRVAIAEGQWVIADPDFGVVLPDLPELTPEVVREAYVEAVRHARVEPIPGHTDLMSYLVAAYAAPPTLSESAASYAPLNALIEWHAYLWKWLVPIVLLLPGALLVLGHR